MGDENCGRRRVPRGRERRKAIVGMEMERGLTGGDVYMHGRDACRDWRIRSAPFGVGC